MHAGVLVRDVVLGLSIAGHGRDLAATHLDTVNIGAVHLLERVIHIVIARPALFPLLAGLGQCLRRKLLLRVEPDFDGNGRDGEDGEDDKEPDPAPARVARAFRAGSGIAVCGAVHQILPSPSRCGSLARRQRAASRARAAKDSGNSALAITATPCSVIVKPRWRSWSRS